MFLTLIVGAPGSSGNTSQGPVIDFFNVDGGHSQITGSTS
jgi:hypothetical protein